MEPDSSRLRSYDYTEGASAIDIQEAIASNSRGRRDSRYGEEGEGAMFDGPSHSVNPSSVSRMSLGERRRRSSDAWSRGSGTRRHSEAGSSEGMRSPHRRHSRDSKVYGSAENGERQHDGVVSDEEEEESHGLPTRSRRGRSPSGSPVLRHSMFDNIAHMFGRGYTETGSPPRSRRPSTASRISRTSLFHRSSSRRSVASSDYAVESEGEGHDRWGYSSGEEDEESVASLDVARGDASETSSINVLDYGSYPPSPSMVPTLPLLAGDAIFGGEARIDMGEFEPTSPPPPGPPSRQTIYLDDEDAHIRMIGYEIIPWRQSLWRLSCVVTCGVLALLGHWFPRLWLSSVAHEKAFIEISSGFVVVETAHRDIALFELRRVEYPYDLATVFSSPADPTALLPISRTSPHSQDPPNGDSGKSLGSLAVLDYRYTRFALDPRTGLFSMIRDWRDSSWSGVASVQHGLDEDVQRQRRTLFGQNFIDIEGKSTTSLLIDEVIHPFYVFQIASMILWSLDNYYYYAFCIALISAVSITTTLLETKKTIARMRKMSRFTCLVNVYVNGAWTERDSSSLVPGDIVNLVEPQLGTIPADIFLLSGDAIVNESMLTGESVPVGKAPVKDADMALFRDGKDISGDMSKSFLYAGTRVVRMRGSLAMDGSVRTPALGLVARIGFYTTKGALVRSMLFPKPMGFKFYRDSIRFILVLTGVAGLGFCASAIQFVRLGVPWHTILIRALDLITVVVPPALPATLSIGTSFAINRLRKLGIYCISPNRVNVAGQINVCCFDKTGTLTEDGLDILGVRSLERNFDRFGELIEDIHDLPSSREKANFLHALATCHSLKNVDGEVIGDPLDVKMFGFTKWTLEEGNVAGTGIVKSRAGGGRPAALVQTVVRPPGSAQFRIEDALKGGRHAHFLELGVIRTFDFVSSLRRMSVIVKRLKSNSMEIYVKGAPEVMGEICDKDSFPQDYDDLLSYYTKRGYRVIAMAGKSIEGLSWLKAQKLKREQAESGLQFLGLVIFENKLKPGTTPAIQALRSAHFACRMITGDNSLTAVSVARECGLINPAAHVFCPIFIRGNATTPLSKLEWTCMDEPTWALDDYTLKPLTPPAHRLVEEDELDYGDYTLAISGDVFRWMINHAPLETLQRMLVKAQVYARMSPDEKNEVVERLQDLGYTVLMCGDGANDCAALKAADVGLSLSEAEASVAAPFTSRTPDISCVLEVIKEGRSALVTSFSCFKYMALYSLIQFTTITLLYSFASSLGDFQFLYIDLFIIIPIAITMGRTLPFPHIHPKRPTASLVSKKVLASLVGQIVITAAIQFWAFFWVRRQEWYTPPPPSDPSSGDDQLEATNFENSALFLVSCFQYILVAAVFSIGPPYRRPMWTNGLLMLSIACLSLFNVVVLLSPPRPVASLLELVPLPFSARITLLGAAILNVVLSVTYEQWGTQAVSRVIGYVMQLRRQQRTKDGKVYKTVEGGMR
ncbi:Ca-transporting ATPase [Laetiporus sulphureus 93-53]|uniref:Cation-transporting ATPase n=1 Tax=Laetiporus sulphureus 93-53 TaxID=1314785 RepID=A0A165DCS2_9APHY|nr:Ca-transporting ATPase [Laetiporus sulphureus 93-53]KZT04578.1 Ca-transporting ATPase [Laetiporus sulphureus 93-53]